MFLQLFLSLEYIPLRVYRALCSEVLQIVFSVSLCYQLMYRYIHLFLFLLHFRVFKKFLLIVLNMWNMNMAQKSQLYNVVLEKSQPSHHSPFCHRQPNALASGLSPLYFCCCCCSYISIISEKAMAPHSSTLAWKIPWTEKPGGLQSMESLRVGHDWATSLSIFTFMHWRRKWQPTPVFLPGESQGRGAWWAAVYGVAQSQTRLKWLSSSSSLFSSGILDAASVPIDGKVQK